MANVQKISYHQDRVEILTKALRAADKMLDRKAYVALDKTDTPELMTATDINVKLDTELALLQQAGYEV